MMNHAHKKRLQAFNKKKKNKYNITMNPYNRGLNILDYHVLLSDFKNQQIFTQVCKTITSAMVS